ncbi:MAG: cytochrome c3 family protein [Desulfamplus sp.]|nr:cytochrome c3 family protein [Desulfamplus sp.]MBF0211785.1 cytochrome c3 family protein [Desulfamplus sp.]
MKRAKSLFIVALLVVFAAAIAIAAENRGGEKITVDGGSKGVVNFPHKIHQDELKDCNICHAKFPQELESIKKLKDKKELKKMQVMNEVCLKCHKAYKAEGKPKYGPINCNGCHGK